MAERPARALFIVSDGTGDTADRVTRAALRQFEGFRVAVHVFPNVTDAQHLDRILKQAAMTGALVVTSLVAPDQRALANELSKAYRIVQIDVIGGVITALSGWLGEAPVNQPGLLHRTDAEYFRRIEAVDRIQNAASGLVERIAEIEAADEQLTALQLQLGHATLELDCVPPHGSARGEPRSSAEPIEPVGDLINFAE